MRLHYILYFLILSLHGIAQTSEGEDGNNQNLLTNKHSGKFRPGLYIGAYFPNNNTAGMYDGYGYDYEGHKNTFPNSFMYRKIMVEYGGGNGMPDQIAQVLNVNPGDWTFDQTDMPLKMRYNPAFNAGLQARYATGKKTAVMCGINASKITVSGKFTIHILNNPVGPLKPNYQNLQAFSITGSEQRMIFHAGLQRVFGDEKKPINFFVEGGISMTFVKFVNNQLHIENLLIDLMTYYNMQGMEEYRAKLLTGISFGAFGGLGINLNTNTNWILQFLYTSYYDRINLGDNPKLAFQHALGFRIYYNL